MKYFYSILFSICVFALGANAQNSGIRFDKATNWNDAVQKASADNKLIFVDCYTSWCIPCKKLAEIAFPDKAVGDYFNARFVNLQFDMEKDSTGVMIKEKYEVTAYPTLLFIDPSTGDLVHKSVGLVSAEQLLAIGEQANHPEENLKRLQERYAAGERTPDMLKGYFITLLFASDRQAAAEIGKEYLNSMPIKEMANPENAGLLAHTPITPDSDLVGRMLDSLDYTYQVLGKEKADGIFYDVFYYPVYEIAVWETQVKKDFNEQRNDIIVERLKRYDNKYTPGMLAMLSTAKYVRQRDFRRMLDDMRENLQKGVFIDNHGTTYFHLFMNQLALCNDNAILQEGIDWLDEELAKTDDLNLKSNLMRRKGNLLQKQGNTNEANLALEQAKEYMNQWQKQVQQQAKQQQ